ncbi:MAG: glycosyltransferase family 2 protein [Candidatus Thiodiazotropha sp. (ex Codakia orbicularis)]|nr:glycosyltransferase family 2 protein [Candidatus Thiodiazotropha sp. (ex Codakia orbicularis)]
MITLFWLSFVCVIYAYFLYPLLLIVVGKYRNNEILINDQEYELPSVTLLLPVHNESNVIEAKLSNIESLEYPDNSLKVILVSDGSTDNTVEIIKNYETDLNLKVIVIENQQGKANALNQGLNEVNSSIVVFTDASIMLDKQSIHKIVEPFSDNNVGCVSGEDHIPANQGGEGLYGKYELFLRNKESKIDSIVGASGSFYAQRTQLIKPFEEGLAPDFLSVLNTVNAGYRAITQPRAIGIMSASKSTSNEYNRKVRTLLRGMAALFSNLKLLNAFKYGWFSVFLFSHKLMRWLVPFFLLILLISNYFLIDQFVYKLLFSGQLLFYSLAIVALPQNSKLNNTVIGKIPLFFTIVNLAILKAWFLFFQGKRQEIWNPTKREEN